MGGRPIRWDIMDSGIVTYSGGKKEMHASLGKEDRAIPMAHSEGADRKSRGGRRRRGSTIRSKRKG